VSDATPLASLQESILAGILGHQDLPEAGLRGLFLDPPAGTVGARWHVYANGLVERAAEAIGNDFPALSKVLGPGPLRSLADRYTRRFPPRSYDLGQIGDRLAGFLGGDDLTRALPFLPDLARLEWAVAEAFVSSDEPPLRWDDLARLGVEAAADLSLRLRPGVAVLRSAWPVHDIWACRDMPASEIDVPLRGRPCSVLVARRGLDVVCRPLDEPSVAVAEAAAAGRRLAEVLEPQDTGEASVLVAAFRALVEDGAFARPPDGSPTADVPCLSGPRRG
jgi:hypothetical protein